MIFCLHGFTGSPGSWDAVRQALGDRAEVVCPAILGHGADSAVASFDDEVDRLAALATPGAHLVGYSQGGRLALGLLVRHPGLFAAATLIGASPGLSSEEERRARRDADERLARLLETEDLEGFLERWEELPLFASQKALPEEVLAAQRRERRAHRPEGLARALRVLGTGRMPDYRPHLGGIDAPVRLLVGELDGKFRHLAGEMAALLPRATVEVVVGIGHNVVLEAPERVAAAILRTSLSDTMGE